MPAVTAVRTAVADRALVAYALLAVGLSWAWWVPVALTGGTTSHFPGLLGPLVAAVVVAGATGGTAGLRRLAGRLGRPRWWALALVPLAVGAGAVAVLRSVGRGPSWEELAEMPGLPAWPWAATFLAVLALNGVGEETGWRGLAWPRLRARLGQRDAALLLTAVWAVWHLPLLWVDSGLADLSLLVLPGWLVGLAAGAVVLGWLYERSGSVAVVALAHTAVTTASGTTGAEGLVAAAVSTAVIAAAVAVLAADRERAAVPGDVPAPSRQGPAGPSRAALGDDGYGAPMPTRCAGRPCGRRAGAAGAGSTGTARSRS